MTARKLPSMLNPAPGPMYAQAQSSQIRIIVKKKKKMSLVTGRSMILRLICNQPITPAQWCQLKVIPPVSLFCYNGIMTEPVLYELNIVLQKYQPGQAELIAMLIARGGIRSQDIVEFDQGMRVAVYFSSKTKAAAIRRDLLRKIRKITVGIKTLKKCDWAEKWKDDFKAFEIVPGVRIIPYGQKESQQDKRSKKVFIDTDSVFGTGLHPTTQMMAQFIYTYKKDLTSFLDIGCGTGILSLIASRVGAGDLWALDISRDAVKTARRNFTLNGIRPDFLEVCDLARFSQKKQFDFVAANLLTEDLIRMKKKIISFVKPGGLLAVSGISRENHDYFIKKFTAKDVSHIESRQDKNWTAALYKKKRV